MSRTTKIIFVVVSTSVLSCVLLCVATFILLPRLASNAFTAAQADPKKVSSQIADYTLPPGYKEEMAFDALIYKTVTIVPASGRGATIMLLQMSTMNANRDQLDQQMRQAFERQFQTTSGVWKVAGERTVTIKGKPATLTISEFSSAQAVMRQAQGVFAGKSGLVMISIYGAADPWDWNMLDAFLQSIR